MRQRFSAFPKLEGEQAAAADPQVHAALSASAGSGKTQVLTARVLRLLLSGVRPETILGLTFTKAGAAEMVNRIGDRLASWVRLKDSELATELDALGEDVGPRTRQVARQLFARVLDAPGGLRIQTIHAFAQALLASFPAEAGVAVGLEPIEGRAEQELVRRTLADLLADAERDGDEQLTGDVQRLSLRLGEQGAVDYLRACARRNDALAALGGRAGIEPRLRALLDVPEGAVEDYLAHHCHDDRFDCDLLHAIAAANRSWNTSTGAGHVELVERWLAFDPAARAAALPDLAMLVFTGKGDPRKITAGQLKADPDYLHHAEALGDAISELLRVQNSANLAAQMASGLRAGQMFAAAYAQAKRAAGVADFDDLISATRRLLAMPGMGEWVRYKLDRQTDHILVDEAQDTNLAQWDIVKALGAEFFSGSSEAEERHRTLFMVGDFKQAIFRFQGTDPREFEAARQWIGDHSAALRDAEDEADDGAGRRLAREFRDLSIAASFRSVQPVLDVVDAVIHEVGFAGMGLPEPPPPHAAFAGNAGKPGLVELWPPFSEAAVDGEESGEEGWLDDKDRAYAEALARRVRAWVDEAPLLASTKRPLTPGDILILVRSRGELASLIVARLFAQGVPVAGIDRLHLSKPFAVRDLLAAVAFAVQPLDDLNLANLLVSPLLGWDQDQLFDLAYDRDKTRLWSALQARREETPELAAAHAALSELLRIADFTTPARFIETILSGPLQGRRKLYGRLGLAARDPIDELLASALEFERGEVPSLDRFLAWFSRGEVEVQRDPSSPVNAVRIMTVHGAKGLEAPYVVLADATADPAKLGKSNPPLDFPIEPGVVVPLVRPTKKEAVSPFLELIANDDELDLQEHMRLLYVGLTRAKERLVIAGIAKPKEVEDCWHRRVGNALMSLGATSESDPEWGEVLRYRGASRPIAVTAKAARVAPEPLLVPEWARTPAPPEARPPRPLAPSAAVEDQEPSLPPSEAMRAAARRGTLIHRLFERLPAVAPEQRHAAALRWLERSAGVAAGAEREEIAGLVCGILGDPAHARLFGPGSLAEAPIAAALPDGTVVAGTVDRLLVTKDTILIADFKTGQVPASDAQIPRSHVAQMTAYAAALRVIFPRHVVQPVLLYTAGPRLFELPA